MGLLLLGTLLAFQRESWLIDVLAPACVVAAVAYAFMIFCGLRSRTSAQDH